MSLHVHFHARSPRALMAAAFAVFAVTACSEEKKVSGGEVAPGAAATTPVASTVAVVDIDVGRAVAKARITDKTSDFKPADTVYTSVHTTGRSASSTVMARWTFEDGPVVQESSQPIIPSGDDYTEFHISKAGGLPKGKYKVEVFLDTKSTGTKDFEVK